MAVEVPGNAPQSFRNLHTYLCDVVMSPTAHPSKSLQLHLDRFRQALTSIFVQPPPNPQHRKEVEQGQVMLNGTLHKINPEFVFETIFLSHQLQLDEYVSAELLQLGAVQASRFDRPVFETAILLYHAERRFHIACLVLIFHSSFDDSLQESGIAAVFDRFARDLVNSTTATGIDFVSHILTLVNTHKQTVQAVNNGTFVPSLDATSEVLKRVAGARLGGDVVHERSSALLAERKDLAELLYLIAYRGDLAGSKISDILSWLEQADPLDDVVLHFMATSMAALDASPRPWEEDATREGDRRQLLRADKSALNQIKTQIQDHNWAYRPIQNVIRMQWCLFLAYAFQRDRTIEGILGVSEDRLEVIMDTAIKDSVFQFLGHIVNGVRKHTSSRIDSISFNSGSTVFAQQLARSAASFDITIDIQPDFQSCIFVQIENLIIGLPYHAHSLLKKIRHREEDVVLAGRRSHAVTTNSPQRDDIEALFTLIASLYRGRPDAGLRFWDEAYDTRLYGFLLWARDCRKPSMIRGLFDMLGSLATGLEASQRAYEFMNAGVVGGLHNICTWGALFGALSFYADRLRGPSEEEQEERPMQQEPPKEISPEEVILLKSFLRLLRQVVRYSPIARTTLQDNTELAAMPTLLSLLVCPVSVDLKGALLDTIAAFCATDSEKGLSFAIDTAKTIWTKLEDSQLVPTGKWASNYRQIVPRFAGLPGPETTLKWNLENKEAPAGTYPLTLSFVNLLSALIVTPVESKALSSNVHASLVSNLPDQLGAEYRTPGIAPYVKYVLDEVYLKLPSMPFKDTTERWALTDVCLRLFEKCLAVYPLDSLMEPDENGRPSTENVTKALLHPGFDIVSRVLCGSPLLDNLIQLVSVGVDALNKNEPKTPSFARAILRGLRLLHRMFSFQAPFLEQMYSYLIDFGLPKNVKVEAPPSVSSLDELLLYRPAAVVQLALYVNAIGHDDICLVAVKFIGELSHSPFFDAVQVTSSGRVNRLLALVESSDESQRIMHGFVERLEIPDTADSSADEDTLRIDVDDIALLDVIAEEEDVTSEVNLVNTVRAAILDLLLENVMSRQAATIGHFLLGFQFTDHGVDLLDKDSGAINAGISCLHMILDLLRSGDSGGASLYKRHPILAEKCFQIIYRLCIEEATSSVTMRYLRVKEDFFYSQVRDLSVRLDESIEESTSAGNIMTYDGQEATISYSTLYSALHQRAWLLKGVALELHTLTTMGQVVRTEKLLDLLYGTMENDVADTQDDEDDPMAMTAAAAYEQPLMRMLEILNNLDFIWQDALRRGASELDPSLFSDVDFSQMQEIGPRGCVVYDIPKIAQALKRHTALSESTQMDNAETLQRAREQKLAMLEYFVAENHEKEMAHAKFHCLQGWKQVLDITLSEDFNLLRPEARESLMYDLIASVLPKVVSVNATAAIAETHSEIAVALMTRLRQDKLYQSVLQDVEEAALPAERLQAVFEDAIDCILAPDTSLRARGNLYAMLLNYLQYTTPEQFLAASKTRGDASFTTPVMDDASTSNGASTVLTATGSSHHSAIELANLRVLKINASRLLDVICRDALEGDDVWKTVAFTLLDALYYLTRRDRSNIVLEYLYSSNYLRRFVQSLREATEDLQDVMSETPKSLNHLYIHEAKTSLLLRLSQRRDGAEKLLEANIFETLSACDYLDMKPDTEAATMDFDGFMPSSTDRYRQVFLPALQVLVGTLSSFPRDNLVPVKRAAKFLDAHRDTLSHILRDNNSMLTLSTISELRLLVAFFYYLSYHLDLSKTQSGSTYGTFHNLLMALLARYFTDRWTEKLRPGNESERVKASRQQKGLWNVRDLSVLEFEAREAVQSLNMYLLAYCQKASDFTASDEALRTFQPLFVWSISGAKEYGERRSTSTTPSISTLAIYLREMLEQLLTDLREHKELLFRSQGVDDLSSQELQEVFEVADLTRVGDLTELNETQKATLAARELQRALADKTESVNISLYMVEILLLLLWRHLNYYLRDYSPDSYLGDMFEGRLSRSSRSVTPGMSLRDSFISQTGKEAPKKKTWAPTEMELETLRSDAQTVLQPLLSKLGAIEISRDVVGVNYRSRNTYLHMLTRRLKEII